MTIKLLASFLLVVSAYVGWWSITTASFLWLIPAVITFIAGTGLFLRKRWSQYLWYAWALIVSLSWVVSVARVALYGGPYDSTLATVIALAPGLFLVVVCAGGSAVVSKHFRGGKNAL